MNLDYHFFFIIEMSSDVLKSKIIFDYVIVNLRVSLLNSFIYIDIEIIADNLAILK